MREGSAPNFAPPVEEGTVFTFEDESGDKVVATVSSTLSAMGRKLVDRAR